MSNAPTSAAPVAAAAPVTDQQTVTKQDEYAAQPKVFVGNLSFKTSEKDLATHFAAAGEVGRARIIRRDGRSQGYAFVSFKAEESVAKAVELFNTTDFNGRPIKVDAAKPRAEGDEPRPPREPREPKKPREKKPRAPKAEAENRSARIDTAGEKEVDGVKAPRSVTASAVDNVTDAKPLKKRNNRKKGPKGPETTAAAAEGSVAPASSGDQSVPTSNARPPRAPRAPRTPRQKVDGPSSKTTLFVANLPFKVDSVGLKSVFQEYQVVSAKVVTLRNGRSKGFGFVELASEEEQQKVLKDLSESDLQVDGRNLSVRVALELEERTSDEPDATSVLVPSLVVA